MLKNLKYSIFLQFKSFLLRTNFAAQRTTSTLSGNPKQDLGSVCVFCSPFSYPLKQCIKKSPMDFHRRFYIYFKMYTLTFLRPN